jgi:methyl-accepting chemotaxis protein
MDGWYFLPNPKVRNSFQFFYCIDGVKLNSIKYFRSKIMSKKLGVKLAGGFVFLLAITLAIVIITVVQVGKIELIGNRVQTLRTPTVQASMTLLNGVNQSLAGLRGYMLLHKEIFKTERQSAWSKLINPSLNDMQEFSKSWTNSENVKRLSEMRELFNNFARYQKEIEDVTLTDANLAKEWLGSKAAPTANKIKIILTDMVNNQQDLSDVDSKSLADNISSLNSLLWILLFVGLAIGIALIALFARIIVTPIKNLTEAAEAMAQGDLTRQVNSAREDEIGKLGNAFNIMVTKIKQQIDEVKAKEADANSAMEQAQEAEKLATNQQEYLEESTKTILGAMDSFSNGDLTVYIKAKNDDDDIGKLFNGFNTAVTNIKNMIGQVKEAVEATASASTQISSSAEEMAAGAQEQSAQTAEVAAAMEEMSRTVVETAANATNSAEASRSASEKANEGAKKLNASKAGMQQIVKATDTVGTNISSLAGKTDQIGEIAQVIDDIADQTNLLALNAAIEAARAGEQGRGFAVVADEVRKLAERTTKATKEIAETIKAIQVEAKEANSSMEEAGVAVKSGMELNDEVGVVLTDILESVDDVSQQINQVAAASEEQSATAEQVSSNIESINNVANESAAVVQQIASASEDLNRLTENLSELVQQFNLSDGHSSSNNNCLLGE